MEKVIVALNEWRLANERARVVEARLGEALRQELGGGPPVPAELMAEVAAARKAADEKLSRARAAMAHPNATRL